MMPEVVPLEIATSAGPIVRGQRWGSGADVAILIHAPGEDIDSWANLPLHLAGDGLAVVAFDLPGHGLSDAPWEPAFLVGSIQAVVDHVRSEGAARIFLVSAEGSVPGALRVAVAGGTAALVALSPPDAEVEQTMADLGVAKLPKLLLVGAGQDEALVAARRIFGRCAGWTVLSTLPTREQGTRLLVGSWGGQAREQIAAFLRDYRSFHGPSARDASDAGD
jgi:pimeloyl-ACP methyl ester carboxylesterase